MLLKEIELVDKKFILRKDVYNIALGGESPITIDSVSVKDKEGNCFRINNLDSRYLNGEFVGVAKDRIRVVDQYGNKTSVYKNNPEYLKGNLIETVKVRDINNIIFDVSKNDIRIKTGELIPFAKNKTTAKDKEGNYFQIDCDDPKLISGELVGMFKGKRHSNKSKQKMKQAKSGKQKGILNSQYGTCWIYNDNLKQNKRIKIERLEEYLNTGWNKGAKMKYH